jgi:short-subunit dehydrogenase involved in D-alanine esterification of teichoic acids
VCSLCVTDSTLRIVAKYPKVDSIILNAGHQRTLDFSSPTTVSIPAVKAELDLNYLSPLATLTAFLPHLTSLSSPASIIFVSSGLALVPLPRCAGYCATKAAIHSLAWSLRAQLAIAGSAVKVIEIIPPAVQTELHSQQPDLVAAGQGSIGVPLDAYADETWAHLTGDEELEEIIGAAARPRFGEVDTEKRKVFSYMLDFMKKQGIKA